MRPVILYGAVRVGLFAVVTAVLLLLGINRYLAAVVAAVVALCIGYIGFGGLRQASAEALASRRAAASEHPASARGADEDAEDAALDRPVEVQPEARPEIQPPEIQPEAQTETGPLQGDRGGES
ncbi:MAG: DUF4229 domain-containing protein [Microbacteriaceae bacterium]